MTASLKKFRVVLVVGCVVPCATRAMAQAAAPVVTVVDQAHGIKTVYDAGQKTTLVAMVSSVGAYADVLVYAMIPQGGPASDVAPMYLEIQTKDDTDKPYPESEAVVLKADGRALQPDSMKLNTRWTSMQKVKNISTNPPREENVTLYHTRWLASMPYESFQSLTRAKSFELHFLEKTESTPAWIHVESLQALDKVLAEYRAGKR